MVATSGFNAPEAHRSLKDARSGLQRSLATVVIGRSLSPPTNLAGKAGVLIARFRPIPPDNHIPRVTANMNEAELEQVRTAMFTDPGVKAVDDLRLVPAKERGRAIAATITVAAPSVDWTGACGDRPRAGRSI